MEDLGSSAHGFSNTPSSSNKSGGFSCLGKTPGATSLRRKLDLGKRKSKTGDKCLHLDAKSSSSSGDAYLPKEMADNTNVDRENKPQNARKLGNPADDIGHQEDANPLYEYSRQSAAKKSTFQDTVPSVPQPPVIRGQTDILDLGTFADCDSGSSSELEVGSLVEIPIHGVPHYGVIRWIGHLHDPELKHVTVAGVEMEEENTGFWDGQFRGHRYFQCAPNKGIVVHLGHCRTDGRFTESVVLPEKRPSMSFGTTDCPVITGDIPPFTYSEDISQICGKNKGIQGHHNSCYLDATLFSMFTFTPVFDSLLQRPKNSDDIVEYEEVKKVLKEEIVNPLREKMFVRADRVMKLRTLLECLGSVTGLTSEEKDPEEFLNSLLQQILKADPLLKLSSGQESYYYQLFVEKDESLSLPTVQHLVHQSFLASDIKLTEVPSCLITLMPRFGKQYKMYPRIYPTPYLEVTEIIENSPRICSVCGGLALFECKDCFKESKDPTMPMIAFCSECINLVHKPNFRQDHNIRELSPPAEFTELYEMNGAKTAAIPVPHLFMELFAVVCIETSHYVAFVKCNQGPDAPWCFFDSMADRRGEQHGYNIPEVVPCPDLKYWLSDQGYNDIVSGCALPSSDYIKRLLSDAYLCMYQSPDVMMYR